MNLINFRLLKRYRMEIAFFDAVKALQDSTLSIKLLRNKVSETITQTKT